MPSWLLHSDDVGMARHFLKSFGMDIQEGCRLIAVEEPLKRDVTKQRQKKLEAESLRVYSVGYRGAKMEILTKTQTLLRLEDQYPRSRRR
jgi:hypothetical protein